MVNSMLFPMTNVLYLLLLSSFYFCEKLKVQILYMLDLSDITSKLCIVATFVIDDLTSTIFCT